MDTAVVIAFMVEIFKFTEMILQFFRRDMGQEQRCKPGRVYDITSVRDLDQFRMACGMFTTLDLFTDLPCAQFQSGESRIDQTGFAHAGISRKGGELSADQLPQLLHALAGFGAGADDGERSKGDLYL